MSCDCDAVVVWVVVRECIGWSDVRRSAYLHALICACIAECVISFGSFTAHNPMLESASEGANSL